MQLETEGEAVKSQDEGDVSAYHKYLVTLVQYLPQLFDRL